MTFTEVFGGTTIYPSGVSYRAVALSANQTLAWPVETATSGNVVAQIMDITPSAGSLSIIMPPANEVSVGETTLFFNPGAFTFTVKDNGGNTIVAVAPGLSYQVYLIGNTTVNGTWRSTQYAAGTSVATAGSLVGAGIKAISTTLNQSMSVTTLNSNYAIGDADRSEAFVWSGGAGAFTLPSSGTVGNDWFCQIRNNGTGAITLTPTGSELINGAPNLTFNPGDSAIVICDGSAFFTIGFGQSAAFAFDYVSIDLSSPVTSPYTLSGANLNRIAYSFGGTLTTNMQVYIPATIQQYWISNDTSGAFTLTVKVAGQIGVIIPQGARGIYYCNGTDIVDADTSSFAFPVTVAQGGTGATTESGARVNLGGTSVGIGVFTAVTAADGRVALSAAASGANSDITSLSGLTTPLSVGQGGTGTATAFTAGSVVFAGASGVYTQDNANLFWDNTNDRLGIGTASPAYKLEVNSAATPTVRVTGPDGVYADITNGTGTLRLQVSSTSSFLGSVNSGPLVFNTAATERMRIESTGNVGIGTTSISAKLQVKSLGQSFIIEGTAARGSGNVYASFNDPTGRKGYYGYGGGDDSFYLANELNANMLFLTNSTERMRITSGGSVGIGVTPTAKLDVYGDIRTSVGSGGTLALHETDVTRANQLVSGADASGSFINATFATGGSAILRLQTAGVERARIDATGNVGIGLSAPTTRLSANGPATVGNLTTLTLNNPYAYGVGLGVAAAGVIFGRQITGDGTSAPMGAIYGGNTTETSSSFGSLTFHTRDTTLQQRMVINELGNVGIGTASPGSLLQLNKASGAADLRLSVAGTLYANIYASSSDVNILSITAIPLVLGTNNTEAMRITSSGNVGIGTASPASKLTVTGTNASGTVASQTQNLDAGGSSVAQNVVYHGAGASLTSQVGSGYTALISSTAVPLLFSTNSTEKARIDSSGNLGVGTSSPNYKIESNGVIASYVASAGQAGYWIYNGGATAEWFTGQKSGTDHSYKISTVVAGAYTDRITVDTSGNLLVGTTSTTPGQTGIIMQPAIGGQVANIDISHANTTASGNSYIRFFYNATSIGSITQDGTAAVLYNTSSDVRLKDNIADADSAASLIDAIQVRKFDWKAGGSHQRYGFVAQELLEVAPEAVSQPVDPDDMMGVDYSKLVPMLVKEIQSLRARVAQLEGN